MGDFLGQTSPSRGRSPTMGADIITHSLPRLTVEFPKGWKRMNERTNERYDYGSNCLYFHNTCLYWSSCFERHGLLIN